KSSSPSPNGACAACRPRADRRFRALLRHPIPPPMDEGTVIPFPLQRRVQAAGSPAGTTWAEPTPAEETPVAGEAFAFLSLEIRRMARNGSFIEGGVAGRILNRCVLSALEVVSKEGAPVAPLPKDFPVRPVRLDSRFANSIGMTNFVEALAPICLSASRYCRLIVLASRPFATSKILESARENPSARRIAACRSPSAFRI